MIRRSYIHGHERHAHYLSDSTLLSLQRNIAFSPEEGELVRSIRHLSDPTKLKIYLLLHKVREISVTDLALILDMSQSAISHALADLKNVGIVESHRCGQLICYSLVNGKRKNKLWRFFVKFQRGR